MMQLSQGHRRAELGFRSSPMAQESMLPTRACATITHASPGLHLKALTLLFAASREVQGAVPVPGFVLQLLQLPPASTEQRGTEQAPVSFGGAIFVQ